MPVDKTDLVSRVRLLAAGAVVLGGVAAVAHADVQRSRAELRPEHVRFLPAPAHTVFAAPVWWPLKRAVVIAKVTGTSPWRDEIDMLNLKSSRLRPLPLYSDPQCPKNDRREAVPLNDGRLAYLHGCYGNEDRIPDRVYSMMTFDPRTGRNARYLPYYLPAFGVFYDISRMGLGVADDNNGLHSRLAWLGANGLRYLGLRFERVGTPAWDSSGREFAVAAVTPGQRATGLSRLDFSWSLYVVDDHGKVVRRLLDGLDEPGVPSWSHDGKWLAIPMHPHGRTDGLWLIRMHDGRPFLLLKGHQIGSATWLPGDRRLVVDTGIWSLVPDANKILGRSDVGLYVVDLPELPR